MAQITLSISELSSLLSRACKAHYGWDADYYAISQLILWAETHGFPGVAKWSVIKYKDEIDYKPQPVRVEYKDDLHFHQLCPDEFYTALWIFDYFAYRPNKDDLWQVHKIWKIEERDNSILEALLYYAPTNSLERRPITQAMEAAYGDAIANGITVDLDQYNIINMVADRTLIEATEESRKGAGE